MNTVVDADDIARRLRVCRRTVVNAAKKVGGVEYLGNKAYLRVDALEKSLGDRYDCLAPDAHNEIPVRGKYKTLREVADILGCSRSTVLRVIERTGLGVTIGKRRYLPESEIKMVRDNVLSPGITTLHKNREALRERSRKMARARWAKQTDKVRHRKVAARTR